MAAWLLLLVTVGQFIAPALPEAWRPLAWLTVTLSAVPLVLAGARLAAAHGRRRRVDRHFQSKLTAAQGQAQARVEDRLRTIHRAFRPENLAAEADRLRLATRVEPGDRRHWQRLLALQGPRGAAWLPLATAVGRSGQTEAALRCAAEALRVGAAGRPDLLAIAEAGLDPRADLAAAIASGQPAVLTAAALRASELDAAAIGRLYAALSAATLPPVLHLTLWQELLTATGDREEAARQRERIGRTLPPDPELGRWLRAGLAGYGPLATAPVEPERPPWRSAVPPRWQWAMRLSSGAACDPPLRRHAPLPVYAVTDKLDLSKLADDLLTIAAVPVAGRLAGDQSPAHLAGQLRRRLWPVEIRCRATIGEGLTVLSGLKAPSHVAAGLEVLGECLGQETDPHLEDLRAEILRLARNLPEDHCRARGLHAAALAQAPVDIDWATRLWDEALTQARRCERGTQRELLAAFVPALLAELRRPDLGGWAGPLLTAAVEAAFDSGQPAALLAATQAVAAQPDGRVRELLLRRLEQAAGAMSGAARFLLAWCRRDAVRLAAELPALWQAPAEGEGWAWTAMAVAEIAGPRHDAALRQLLGRLRPRLRAGDGAAVAAQLVLGHRLDGLEGRTGRPEAQRALQTALALPPAAAGEALTALRATLAEPDARWLDAVEAGLLKRLAARTGRGGGDDLRLVDAIADLLPAARLEAHVARWLEAWRHGVEPWERRMWASLTP